MLRVVRDDETPARDAAPVPARPELPPLARVDELFSHLFVTACALATHRQLPLDLAVREAAADVLDALETLRAALARAPRGGR